ncbi:AraC family transcriptional regulator [uncultured Roseobacter sp.]|uniref:helix-turn-helix domain-containing protein n=1 Tax=uncultured Roseobacter sp. TaxID=114847 RepID=UPI00344F9025
MRPGCPGSLSQRVQALLGLAPFGCIRKWRVIFALQMLRTLNTPLAEIAERVGYGPVNSFRVAFMKDVGVPPSRWRLRVKERKMSKERRDDR